MQTDVSVVKHKAIGQLKEEKNIFLFLRVYQNGALQDEKTFNLNTKFAKKITIGSSFTSTLCIPFARILENLNIFKVGLGKVRVLLDPRLTGFLNTGNKFGDLKEFTSPRGALADLTSIEEPYSVDLNLGSRGVLTYFGFQIVFKIEKSINKPIKLNFPKLEKNAFGLPEYDIPIERNAIIISIIATGIAFLPMLFWLLTAQSRPSFGLLNLSDDVSLKYIAPENIRLLPFVFKEKYEPKNTILLSIFWVYELQKRWERAEKGLSYKSIIPFLYYAHNYKVDTVSIDSFVNQINKNYTELENSRIEKGAPRYFSFLKPYPVLSTILTGNGIGGSEYLVLRKRLEQLKNVDRAIIEYLSEEHEILKKMYEEEFNSKKVGIVDPPFTGQVLGRQPDESFNVEFEAYKNAERFAAIAENSKFRNVIEKGIANSLEHELNSSSSLGNSVVWIDSKNLIYPSLFIKKSKFVARDFALQNMLENAKYSTGIYEIPKLPPPVAVIDKKMVEFVLYNKKEEIRSCYNSSLRKNQKLKGELVFSWKILENGIARDITVLNSNTHTQELVNCIKSRISLWHFPKPKNGSIIVQYPFYFSYSK